VCQSEFLKGSPARGSLKEIESSSGNDRVREMMRWVWTRPTEGPRAERVLVSPHIGGCRKSARVRGSLDH
jgi:hypothetical protein